jgi:hypothetical protein
MNKSTIVKMFGRSYEVPFPSTGDFLSIQTMYSRLIRTGVYPDLKIAKRDGLYADIIAEAIATFSVLIGDKLRADMNTDSLLKLPLEQMFELTFAYKDDYINFYEEIMEVISNPKKEAKEAAPIA